MPIDLTHETIERLTFEVAKGNKSPSAPVKNKELI